MAFLFLLIRELKHAKIHQKDGQIPPYRLDSIWAAFLEFRVMSEGIFYLVHISGPRGLLFVFTFCGYKNNFASTSVLNKRGRHKSVKLTE